MKKFLVMIILGLAFISTQTFFNPALAIDDSKAADFTLKDLNGNSVSLSNFKDKKAVILFFWASWCHFCRSQLPLLEKEYPKIKSNDIEVLAIDSGENEARVKKFADSNGVTFPVLLDKNQAVSEDYEVAGIPTYILVNEAGVIVYRGNHLPDNYIDLLKEK